MIRIYAEHGPGRIGHYSDVRVRVYHRTEDGYKLAGNGEEIKEDLPIREFLERIFRVNGQNSQHDVERALYEIHKTLSAVHMSAIEHIARTYDGVYSKLIRTGKLVLPEHTMATHDYDKYRGFVDPFDNGQQRYQQEYQRAMMMQNIAARPGQFPAVIQPDPAVEEAKRKEFLRANEEEKTRKESEDIYYLLTDDQKDTTM